MTAREQTRNPEQTITDELQAEVARQNFVRAAEIAAARNVSAAELRNLQIEALWQMTLNRNAPGMNRLALSYGISMQEIRQLFQDRCRHLSESNQTRNLGPCYDGITGRYLTLEAWLDAHTRPQPKRRGLGLLSGIDRGGRRFVSMQHRGASVSPR
jgi:hypothetical protein